MKPELRWLAHREPLFMALVSGFVDTLGFVALFGLFTAHVTGNLVLVGAEFAGGHSEVVSKLVAIPVFILAVGLTTIAIHRSKSASAILPKLMMIEALWLSVAMIAGLHLRPLVGADAPATMAVGMPMIVAMGMRNAAAKLILGFTAPTTIMTGNVVQLTIDVFSLPDPAAKQRIGKYYPTVVGFIIGAGLAAVGYSHFSFAALLLPIGITVGLAVAEWRSNF